MNKMLKFFFTAVLSAALLCGCSEKPVPAETTTAVTTDAEDYKYLLVRPWSGKELLNSIYFCGEKRPLPLSPEENGFTLSEGVLTLPEGTAAAEVGEDGSVTALMFERSTAPADLNVYGIGFSSVPDDIPSSVGIADSVSGSANETITYSFFGGGITELTFVYTNRRLMSVYIAV